MKTSLPKQGKEDVEGWVTVQRGNWDKALASTVRESNFAPEGNEASGSANPVRLCNIHRSKTIMFAT
jgi:hypothetical protein